MALSIGHADLESPSCGGTYSGHFRRWPGAPSGTTCPALSFGVTRFARAIPLSQQMTARSVMASPILPMSPIVLLVFTENNNNRSIKLRRSCVGDYMYLSTSKRRSQHEPARGTAWCSPTLGMQATPLQSCNDVAGKLAMVGNPLVGGILV